ncbi:hypothetical protein BDV96DRAFT_675010, partial [Lophiotrema nucula]
MKNGLDSTMVIRTLRMGVSLRILSELQPRDQQRYPIFAMYIVHSMLKHPLISGTPTLGTRYTRLYSTLPLIVDSLAYQDVKPDADGCINLQKVAQTQTVLICRTGLDAELSHPISLDTLRPHALALSTCANTDPDILRVSLSTAIKFVTGIAKQEDAGRQIPQLRLGWSLNPYPAPHGFEYSNVSVDPETWADAVIHAAKTIGWDKELDARDALKRVQAVASGE